MGISENRPENAKRQPASITARLVDGVGRVRLMAVPRAWPYIRVPVAPQMPVTREIPPPTAMVECHVVTFNRLGELSDGSCAYGFVFDAEPQFVLVRSCLELAASTALDPPARWFANSQQLKALQREFESCAGPAPVLLLDHVRRDDRRYLYLVDTWFVVRKRRTQ